MGKGIFASIHGQQGEDGAHGMSDKAFLEAELKRWQRSEKRQLMITGEKYYTGEQDILERKRSVIGEDGNLVEVENLPNNRIVDNQYAKMVDQKSNYLLGQPFTVDTDNKEAAKVLKGVFNKQFQRTMKAVGDSSLNGGIAWLFVYYDAEGQLAFKRFEPFEILPFWADAEHTQLDAAARLYDVEVYEGGKAKTVQRVEVFTLDGITRYKWENNMLKEDEDTPTESYVRLDDTEWNWQRLPLIPFKYNNKEIPLIKRVKPLQDGINLILSDFENNMQEDPRNTVLILQNYDGENLGEFRRNLATYGAVKVRTVDGVNGDVRTLEIKVNAENYKAIHLLFKKALIENARGYDAKDERLNNNPNQMNIQSIYTDIDLDANGMETEFQASFEQLLWFVLQHLKNTGQGDFVNETVEIIFNRDVLINETDAITNCSNSVGILSQETIVGQHPWVDDVEKEMQRIKDEEAESGANNPYAGAFGPQNGILPGQDGAGVMEHEEQ